mmetsp:Transcript_19124/g.29477  ORF Transcript_19124/g.29477 Transcript_19124/m.29477 type:complete len:135 (+) Transcript_19124:43-447(+)
MSISYNYVPSGSVLLLVTTAVNGCKGAKEGYSPNTQRRGAFVSLITRVIHLFSALVLLRNMMLQRCFGLSIQLQTATGPARTRNLNGNLQFQLLLANQHDHHDQESDEYMSSIFLLLRANPEIEDTNNAFELAS